MKVFIVGAGQVGATVAEALHIEHELTVLDTEPTRLNALAYRFDLATFEGDGTSRRDLIAAGIRDADLIIAATSRDEVNLVAGMFGRREAPRAKTIIRTSETEYIELWRDRQLDVDFVVCPEYETAHAISRTLGVPAARQTDVFANGQVQIVEFDVESGGGHGIVDLPLREARIPHDSKVASIIRGETMTLPGGDSVIHTGDRIVVIGSPEAARTWGEILAPWESEVTDVVIFGGGRVGAAIARALVEQRIAVRLIEPNRERARDVAEALPDVRVYNATGLDPEFLERERIGRAQAAIFAMRDDAKNHFAAALARVHGVEFTIAIVHEPIAQKVYEASNVDVTVNPRQVTAEEIVRFARDPRTHQLAMIEGDRFEVLDLTCRPESEYVGKRFRDMPIRGALIGAVVRGGKAIFPHGDDTLLVGDRVIVFTEAANVPTVERAL